MKRIPVMLTGAALIAGCAVRSGEPARPDMPVLPRPEPSPAGSIVDNGAAMIDAAAQDVLDTLQQAMESFARQMLRRRSDFYPFALAAAPDGRIVAVTPDLEATSAERDAIVGTLEAALRRGAADGQYVAGGICRLVADSSPDAGAPTDAVLMRLEHGLEGCRQLVIPWERSAWGEIEFGAPRLETSERFIFETGLPRRPDD